ncbi:hypothetical protein O6H91_01G095600 [Diphasiastrum complanatum]|uniref:Uncharacterized protein n=1 Tax=Diphasiastrum complanatum TaxID=34168 RepID=A0ACC2ETP1_DIPCM|nr:hypothetical protein O6H91_01G095600 [Diphasiastrum complanatum]
MEFVPEFGGEETVVFMVIARMLFAFFFEGLRFFIYEALALVLLTAAAFLLEIVSKRRNFQHPQSRPGAASGIILGAITWPTVFAAHLLHCVRFVSNDETMLSGIKRVKGEFWVSIACSIRFLYVMARELLTKSAVKGTTYTTEGKVVAVDCTNLTLSNMKFVHGLALLLSFFTLSSSLSGLSGALVVTCGFFQVWGCDTLIYYIFSRFPACATPGEGILVAEGLTLYAGNAAFYGISKVTLLFMSSQSSGLLEIGGDDIDAVLQAILLALLLVPSLYGVINESMASQRQDSKVVDKDLTRLGDLYKALHFLIVLGFAMLVLAPWWLYLVRGLQQHLFLRILDLVLDQPLQRLTLCGYWVIVLGISLAHIYEVAKNGKTHRIIVRKYYHLVSVIMFVPALIFEPDFLRLAFGVALATFLVIEMIRALKIPPLGAIVHNFMKAFTDERDSDLLIVSHFSLLLGCAMPLWLNISHNRRPLASFAGILSVGIGDTMASIVGLNFGSWRLTKYTKKTLEGTLAGILSVIVACSLIIPFLPSGSFTVAQWSSLVFATLCSGLVEAYTTQLDNLFVPLIFYALLCL